MQGIEMKPTRNECPYHSQGRFGLGLKESNIHAHDLLPKAHTRSQTKHTNGLKKPIQATPGIP